VPVVVPLVVPVVVPVVVTPEVVPDVVPDVVPVVEVPVVVECPGAEPELPGGLCPPGAPFSQPLCLPGLFSRRSRPLLRYLSSVLLLLVSVLDWPGAPTALSEVVSVLLVPVPSELELWLAPLDEPIELLPELLPDLLMPAEPNELGV